jgi:hypothetical protein
MAAKKQTKPEVGTRLLDLWVPPPEAGRPIGCVATTFTFDANHFEEQCLGRFLSMQSDATETLKAYLIEREEKLSQTFACVLADQRNVMSQRSLRWHLLGVRLPGAGIQHAKLSVLLWERHLRVLISSANLTPPGYRSNLEVVVPFDFSPSGGPPLPLATECLDYLDGLASYTAGTIERPGPRRALSEFLAGAHTRIGTWPTTPQSSRVRCELVPLLPDSKSGNVLTQLRQMWQGAAPTGAIILSPFFDRNEDAIDRLYRELAALLTKRGDREIHFASSGRKTPTNLFQIDIPSRLVESHLRHESTRHTVGYVAERQVISDGDAFRPLHSKAMLLDNAHQSLIMFGSSNCTVAGLGLIPTHNAELNVAYHIPTADASFSELCLNALPPITWLDVDDQKELIQGLDCSEDAISSLALLPGGFVEALFRPLPVGGLLELSLDPDHLPHEFAVLLPGGAPLLQAGTWRSSYAAANRIELPLAEVASGLIVRWLNSELIAFTAAWPINVTDTSLLMPPAELRDLALEDLILVLTSARPSFQVLANRSAKKIPAGPPRAVTDPHKRVDTSRFLLKRMRRLAKALEGLRRRLELPVASIEGWRWRLQGPLGPVALARALKADSHQDSAFFISEIAATMKVVTRNPGDCIGAGALQEEIAIVLRMLRELSFERFGEMPPNLASYVHDVYSDVAP